MADNDSEQDKNTKSKNWDFIDILKTFIPLLGIFSAFSYILGRYYLDAYYRALGIAPTALSLTTNDYMFFSISIVILCLFIVLLFFIYWEWSEGGKRPWEYILKFKDGVNKFQNMSKWEKIDKWKKKIDLWTIFLSLVIAIIILCVAGLVFSTVNDKATGDQNDWIVFICSFIILVFAMVLTVEIFCWIFDKVGEKQRKAAPYGPKVILAIAISLEIFLLIIQPINIFARSQAKEDVEKAPWARIVTTDNFSSVIVTDESIQKEYLDGQLILTNNGYTYLSVKYIVPKDRTEKMVRFDAGLPSISAQNAKNEVEHGFGIEIRQTYAIPVSSIRDIIYLPDYDKK